MHHVIMHCHNLNSIFHQRLDHGSTSSFHPYGQLWNAVVEIVKNEPLSLRNYTKKVH